jgi:hypothetical protein
MRADRSLRDIKRSTYVPPLVPPRLINFISFNLTFFQFSPQRPKRHGETELAGPTSYCPARLASSPDHQPPSYSPCSAPLVLEETAVEDGVHSDWRFDMRSLRRWRRSCSRTLPPPRVAMTAVQGATADADTALPLLDLWDLAVDLGSSRCLRRRSP